jgi:DNA-binding NarL/FixJ family response regulator
MEIIKVAIVEDETSIREEYMDIFETTEGFSLSGAYSNAQEAITQLPLIQAEVVLMDIQLSPQDTGIEVIKKIRHLCPNTQFMMFTVFEDDNNVFESIKAGATGYILKKTPYNRVLDAVRELNEGGSPMSAGIARKVLSYFQSFPPVTEDYKLTPREKQIMEALAKGLLYKEVASELTMSEGNVKQRVHSIYQKLEVYNRTEALNKYFKK